MSPFKRLRKRSDAPQGVKTAKSNKAVVGFTNQANSNVKTAKSNKAVVGFTNQANSNVFTARMSPFRRLRKHGDAPQGLKIAVNYSSKICKKRHQQKDNKKSRTKGHLQPGGSNSAFGDRQSVLDDSAGQNAPPCRLYAIMLSLATLFFGFLEGRKIYELRKQKFDFTKCDSIFMVCTEPVRRLTGVRYMLEGNITWMSKPLCADEIVCNKEYLAGTMLSDEEVKEYLGSGTGYLYKVENVRISNLIWFRWPSNGSNCSGFVPQFVINGQMKDRPRFGPVEWDQPEWNE